MICQSFKFQWIECWDCGQGSKFFDTVEECILDAKVHVKTVRWTEREMRLHKNNYENFLMIQKVFFDEDGEEVLYEDTGYSEIVNEDTVDRVY